MQSLNQQIFLLVNASAHPNPIIVQLAIVVADSPLIVGPLLMAALWVWGAPARRGALLTVAGALLLGQSINLALGQLHFEPRPFMAGIGHTLLAHPPDNSFPSDHATFVWTLGLGLVVTGGSRRCGWAMCAYGFPLAWSRVFLGIHFPDDMAVSALVAIAAAGCARLCQPAVTMWLLPSADRLYEKSLPALRLSPALFPRGAAPPRAKAARR